MKKTFVLLLTLITVLSFVGCAAGYDSVTDTNYGTRGYYNRGYGYNTDYNGTDYNGTYDGVNGYNRSAYRSGYSTYNGSGANNTGMTY